MWTEEAAQWKEGDARGATIKAYKQQQIVFQLFFHDAIARWFMQHKVFTHRRFISRSDHRLLTHKLGCPFVPWPGSIRSATSSCARCAVNVSVTKEMCGVASQHITPMQLQTLFACGTLYLQRCLHYLNYRGLGHEATCYFPLDGSWASTVLTLRQRDPEWSLAGPKQVSLCALSFLKHAI